MAFKKGHTVNKGKTPWNKGKSFTVEQGHRLLHGVTGTPFYRVWGNIKSRCENKKVSGYKNYGGRGIKCEWNSFVDFKRDMYKSYKAHVKAHGEKNTFIERSDNDGNYTKNNCRWATRAEQSMNRRNNLYLTHKGEIKHINEWAKEKGLTYVCIQTRIRRGWPVDLILNTPLIPYQKVNKNV